MDLTAMLLFCNQWLHLIRVAQDAFWADPDDDEEQ
jgi:hypothetical protein